jgi:hypothetical protein
MNKHINTIVITGGPCAGKHQAKLYIKKKLEELGYGVIVVPEFAREMIVAGCKPHTSRTIDLHQFEKHLLKGQKERENRYRNIAEDIFGDKVVILFDRGVIDAKAFFGEESWKALLEELCIQEHSLFERYDGVIHLRTAAHGNEEAFLPEPIDIARTPEQAREECDQVLEAWKPHWNLHVIENQPSLEEKMNKALEATIQALPYPM